MTYTRHDMLALAHEGLRHVDELESIASVRGATIMGGCWSATRGRDAYAQLRQNLDELRGDLLATIGDAEQRPDLYLPAPNATDA